MDLVKGSVIVVESCKYMVVEVYRDAVITDTHGGQLSWPEQFAVGKSFKALDLTGNSFVELAVFDKEGETWVLDWRYTEGGICRCSARDLDEWLWDGGQEILEISDRVITVIAA